MFSVVCLLIVSTLFLAFCSRGRVSSTEIVSFNPLVFLFPFLLDSFHHFCPVGASVMNLCIRFFSSLCHVLNLCVLGKLHSFTQLTQLFSSLHQSSQYNSIYSLLCVIAVVCLGLINQAHQGTVAHTSTAASSHGTVSSRRTGIEDGSTTALFSPDQRTSPLPSANSNLKLNVCWTASVFNQMHLTYQLQAPSSDFSSIA